MLAESFIMFQNLGNNWWDLDGVSIDQFNPNKWNLFFTPLMSIQCLLKRPWPCIVCFGVTVFLHYQTTGRYRLGHQHCVRNGLWCADIVDFWHAGKTRRRDENFKEYRSILVSSKLSAIFRKRHRQQKYSGLLNIPRSWTVLCYEASHLTILSTWMRRAHCTQVHMHSRTCVSAAILRNT